MLKYKKTIISFYFSKDKCISIFHLILYVFYDFAETKFQLKPTLVTKYTVTLTNFQLCHATFIN